MRQNPGNIKAGESYVKGWDIIKAFILTTLLMSGPVNARSMQTTIDTIHTVVVLIDFSDAQASFSLDRVNDILNTPGYTEEDDPFLINVRDYIWEVSRHNVDIVNHVFGYYRAPRTRAYYRGEDWSVSVQMFGDALNWAKDNHPDFDWDQLSLDSDGTILGLTAMCSGSIPGTGGTHWIGSRFTLPNGHEGGQLVGTTVSTNLFTILHEYGHMLFNWPDLYNINQTYGTGQYDLMSSNTDWIGVPNASLLMEHDWLDVIDITGSQAVTLDENGNTAVRYRNSNDPDEYFVIEARNNKHPTTARIGGASRGLYIWHVDDNLGGNGNYSIDLSAGEHYHIALEQADGRFDLENHNNQADEGDAYAPGDVFTESSTPNSNWYDDSPSDLSIENIQFLDNDKISFDVIVAGAPVGIRPVAAAGNTGVRGDWALRIEGSILRYRIPAYVTAGTAVEIQLYTLGGRQTAVIADHVSKKGWNSVALTYRTCAASGTYLCSINAGGFHTTEKVIFFEH